MGKFDGYRPKFDVAMVMVVVAVISIAALFVIEIDSPRMSHQPQPPSAGTQSAADQAGARVTPSNPAEMKPAPGVGPVPGG